MFSRPVSSGWKPVPTSSSAPTRPRNLAVALGGWVIRERIFEQRALAGAVMADDAERLAALDIEVDVPQRPEVLCLWRVGRSASAARVILSVSSK